jgi:hypothetical protein
MSETTEVVIVADPALAAERIAVAGFLAGYRQHPAGLRHLS